MHKFLTMLTCSFAVILLVGCGDKKAKEDEHWDRARLSSNDPLGESTVLAIYPDEIPFSGYQLIYVQSANGDEKGRMINSVETIATSLKVKVGDHVLIREYKVTKPERAQFRIVPAEKSEPAEPKASADQLNYERVVRVVSIDMRYDAKARAERMQGLEAERLLSEANEKAKEAAAEAAKAAEAKPDDGKPK